MNRTKCTEDQADVGLDAKRGALWDAHRRHYGKDRDPVLVWQADTRSMNPMVEEKVISEAYQQDEAAVT